MLKEGSCFTILRQEYLNSEFLVHTGVLPFSSHIKIVHREKVALENQAKLLREEAAAEARAQKQRTQPPKSLPPAPAKKPKPAKKKQPTKPHEQVPSQEAVIAEQLKKYACCNCFITSQKT